MITITTPIKGANDNNNDKSDEGGVETVEEGVAAAISVAEMLQMFMEERRQRESE